MTSARLYAMKYAETNSSLNFIRISPTIYLGG
jgi:hypothetical protein